ncbi:unnamed protein product [Tilletia controversa]|uniref:Galactose oxidase n=3 Tax=Tilletia TaxID=13289 RepID=A0A8X7MLK8_9BASI|nr:hypothetical protein CF336_g7666 [Tilletia laevis]KAE8186406.1 hypothetical protein CF328_g7239 [Tilletia controversa]KAE8247286.1 hypothetical protein A4X03_0g7088 [Tilletia caries]KAE8187130.1 hypothetical protein CF335_g7259 [Tilletia laevis]KAE8239825.1 hypothetical protein A4X06_0g8021 [Tilletia controversa]
MRTASVRRLKKAAAATTATLAILPYLTTPAFAADCTYADKRCAGQYQVINTDSIASAMMMGLLNQKTVWILDKTEGNPRKNANGRSYWASFLDLTTNQVYPADTTTNAFCAGGTTLGNGTWLVAGGNQPVDQGGAPTNIALPSGVYQDGDGRKAVRIIEPNAFSANDPNLAWIDNYTPNATNNHFGAGLQMQSWRWYPGVEPLADGSAVLIGGANNGGYINRNTPNTDPAFAYPPGVFGNLDGENLYYGGANPTYEFWPSKGDLKIVNFMNTTSGLNMYPHTFLMPDGKIFMQANFSTTLWDPLQNTEDPLPDMPDKIVRVYPASGATAMLPLLPENGYQPTILFCGGTILSDDAWGNYTGPNTNVLNIDASSDCSSITPVDAQGNKDTNAQYVREEKMPGGRTMGNAIHLPDGTIAILNGAHKGTAGYANATFNIINAGQPNEIRTEGLAQNPAYQPLIYDPTRPLGKRLSSKGLGYSDHERLYHSTAILIPDGSVLVSGSNGHQDVALTMPTGVTPQAFNTSYIIEKWYPPYYFETRPQVTGLPTNISYGGKPFKVTIGADYMGQYANWRAAATKFRVIRTGFSTHAMNLGQRSLQLQSTYTVNSDGSVTFMVSPMPPNANLFAPGPAMIFADVNGIPSYGQFVQVGWTSKTSPGPVPMAFPTTASVTLPTAVNSTMYNEIPPEAKSDSSFSLMKIIIIAAIGGAALLVILLGFFCWRRRQARGAMASGGKRSKMPTGYAPTPGGAWQPSKGGTAAGGPDYERVDTPHSFVPPPHGQFRGSMGTFDSFKMQDVGNGGSSPGGGPGGPHGGMGAGGGMHSGGGDAYFDYPRRNNGGTSPAPMRSPLGRYDDASSAAAAGAMGSPVYSTRELPSDHSRTPTERMGSQGSTGPKAQEASLLSPYGYQPYEDGYQQPDAYGGGGKMQQHVQGGYGQSLSPNVQPGYSHGGSESNYAPSGMSHGSEQAFYDASNQQANSFYGHGR